MNLKRVFLITSLLFFLTALCPAQSMEAQWLHVRVESPDEEESVKVNVPLSLVETVLPMIETEEFQRGRVQIDSEEITVPEMREIWEVVKAQGDYELASISTKDTSVRISIEGDTFFIRSREGSASDVLVTLPTRVVDALLSGEGEELNISSAVQALAASGGGELVSVKDGNTTVRVWLDGMSSAE